MVGSTNVSLTSSLMLASLRGVRAQARGQHIRARGTSRGAPWRTSPGWTGGETIIIATSLYDQKFCWTDQRTREGSWGCMLWDRSENPCNILLIIIKTEDWHDVSKLWEEGRDEMSDGWRNHQECRQQGLSLTSYHSYKILVIINLLIVSQLYFGD